MFKPQKPTGPSQPSRHKLPLIERPPKQEDIATLFTGALRIRGTLFELPIRPAPMSSLYIITCMFDHGCNETVWGMYEGSESGNQLFHLPQSDLDMVFDMVCMSCGTTGSATMPAELSPGGAYPPPAPAASQYPMNPPGQSQYQGQGQGQGQQGQYQQGGQYPQQGQGQYPQQGQGQGQQGNYQQGGQYPQQGQGQYQQQGQGQQGQNPYQQQQSAPYPQQQGQYGQQQAPYPQQQAPYGQQQQQAPYPPQQQAPYGQQNYPTQPYGQQGQGAQAPSGYSAQNPTPPGSAAAGAEIPMPEFANFIDLLNKGSPNLLLGHLFVESGIMPEKCLDAALKLQEMVRKGKLNNQQAVLAMKRAAELGGNLDDDIIEWARDPEAAQRRGRVPTGSSANPASAPPVAKPAAAAAPPPPRDNVAAQRIADLLKQAGLVSEEDLETARKVKSKHGGELTQILVSAGRLNNKTVDAAAEVQNLVAVGRLRIDKAIMALHYCERMRVGLKEALTELNIEIG